MARRKGGLPWWLGDEVRHLVSFVFGLGFGYHEIVLTDKQRPFVLGFTAAMIGVPMWDVLGRLAEQVRRNGDQS